MEKQFGGIMCMISEEFPGNRDALLESQADFVECWLKPEQTQERQWLEAHGFYFLDRFLDCRIILRNLPEKPKRFRFETGIGTASIGDLQKLYRDVFTRDRRMHLGCAYDQDLAKRLIDGYIAEAQSEGMALMQCQFRDKTVGYAFLQESDSAFEIFLAGVLPEYQKTGAAVELYRACADFAIASGKRLLTGRISSSNTDVMNLYARLGANFYHPRDVYAKDQRGAQI